jgi:hypothetical protein
MEFESIHLSHDMAWHGIARRAEGRSIGENRWGCIRSRPGSFLMLKRRFTFLMAFMLVRDLWETVPWEDVLVVGPVDTP